MFGFYLKNTISGDLASSTPCLYFSSAVRLPVAMLPPAEVRKRTASATPWGRSRKERSAFGMAERLARVSMILVITAFTVMRRFFSSFARLRVRAYHPALQGHVDGDFRGLDYQGGGPPRADA